MRDPQTVLSERMSQALERAFGSECSGVDPAVRRSNHADYQANVALSLAKTLRNSPRRIAEELMRALDIADICEPPVIAGAGFINLTLRSEFLAGAAASTLADPRFGVAVTSSPETVVVDYSSPNTAKEMQVHHLRSTIIGDCLARTLSFIGHRVVRQNHLGDWGTPFGMLIEHLLDLGAGDPSVTYSVDDLNEFYREARKKFDADPAFAERARLRVVELQRGDESTIMLWRRFVDESKRHMAHVYTRLGVLLREEDVRGESFYNPMLGDVVDELARRGLAVENDGALCVFLPGFTNRENDPLPLIVRKQDGGYGYATTDLAAIRYRRNTVGATRILYVVGAPQQQHFAMVFETAKQAGWLGEGRAEHVMFGSMLGADKKMYKTRSGQTVKLTDLLDEAVERALSAVEQKNPDLDASVRASVAQQVGIGAIKYADLSSDRIKDYVFDWDRMLAFEGNTGPYLMYAHARIRSILRKAVAEGGAGRSDAVSIEHDAERRLAIELLGFEAALTSVDATLQPHRLCTYLYELATAFTGFYENCPVLRADTDELRASRLGLCELTAGVLRTGLELLGIEAPDRM